MWRKLALPFLAFLLVIVPAQAEESNGPAGIEAALTQPSLIVDDIELNTEELSDFYKLRQYRPVWETHGAIDHAALASFLANVETFVAYHGLQPESYPVDWMKKLIANTNGANSVKLELAGTDWLLRLAHDLHGDDLDLNQLYPGWMFQRAPVDIAAGLAKAVDENRVHDFITSLAPTSSAYTRLAEALKAYREKAQKGPWPVIAPGPKLMPGMHEPRVAQMRARLAAEGYIEPAILPGASNETYDSALFQAVKNYQGRNGLKTDGHVGPMTFAAMNMPLKGRIEQIMANMERLRHMPDSLPARYAAVNIADTTVSIMDGGKLIYRGPVIVGRPDRKTPFIKSAIRSMIFNPAWHVPSKIARKDILPKLRQDPHYLEKLGFVINGSADDPYGDQIDWNRIRESEFNFRLRQSPGDMNSLGRLKFDFDNDFAVYMHGTPHQELFDKDARYFSSGCIRLRDPDQFALLLLAGNDGGWTLDKIHDEVDQGKTHWLRISQPLPLYVVYWTVFTDDDGALNFRNDVYGYDRFLIDSLREENQPDNQAESHTSPTTENRQVTDKLQ
jgi:murein L,D-transpeptidase YcbB/YkuD